VFRWNRSNIIIIIRLQFLLKLISIYLEKVENGVFFIARFMVFVPTLVIHSTIKLNMALRMNMMYSLSVKNSKKPFLSRITPRLRQMLPNSCLVDGTRIVRQLIYISLYYRLNYQKHYQYLREYYLLPLWLLC